MIEDSIMLIIDEHFTVKSGISLNVVKTLTRDPSALKNADNLE